MRRRSLRTRILFAFVLSGAVVGPLVAGLLLYLSYELEERMVERTVETRLQDVLAAPHDFTLRVPESAPGLHILTNLRTEALPPELLQLPDGIHEYEAAGEYWTVALATTEDGRRFGVVEDTSLLGGREHLGATLLIAGILLSVYAALWLGFYLSRRLVAPLIRLSDRISADGDDAAASLAEGLEDDEVGMLADALDRYRARMNQTLRREQEFSADVSHELRTPLTVIGNAAELIEQEPELSATTRRAVQRIEHGVERMQETVNALLLMVREPSAADSGEWTDVAEAVDAVLRRGTAAATPPIEWHPLAHPTLSTPRIAAEVIAANLIRNARQHSGAGRIDVTLRANRLIVEDDGVGIPPEDLPHVARRGHRGANATTGGSGLGLSLVQRLCDRYGWRLIIDSTLGRGTRTEWEFQPEGEG